LKNFKDNYKNIQNSKEYKIPRRLIKVVNEADTFSLLGYQNKCKTDIT
jgi:hypothetical protein